MLTAASNATVRTLIAAYIASEPRLSLWQRWPDVSDDEYDATDDWECTQIAAAFAAFARIAHLDAVAVRGTDPDHDFAGTHAWTRIRIEQDAINVDFTARQYHNLDGAEWVLDEPWPVVWNTDASSHDHPIVGRFGAVAPA